MSWYNLSITNKAFKAIKMSVRNTEDLIIKQHLTAISLQVVNLRERLLETKEKERVKVVVLRWIFCLLFSCGSSVISHMISSTIVSSVHEQR